MEYRVIDNETLENLEIITERILALDDEGFDANAATIFVNAARGSVEESVRKGIENDVIKSFETNNFTEEQVADFLMSLEDDVYDYVQSIETTNENKRDAIRGACDIVVDSFKDAAIDYVATLTSVVQFELAMEGAKLPTYAHPTDAGADIYCPVDVTVPARARGYKVDSGLKMAIPEGWRVLIYPRSGISAKTNLRLSNCVGVIDANYRGPVCVLFDNLGSSPIEIKAGDRIAQMVFEKNCQFKPVAVETVDKNTDRGEGGFGSTDAQ